VELGIVIGKHCRHVSKEDSLDYVFGYCLANDVSERSYQLERGGQWDKGKAYDTFAPLGPWLVTKDEIANVQDLALSLEVDGKVYQDGSTRNMIFDVPTLVAYISQFMSLHPGDVIITGTPAGVGLGQKPTPIYLQTGQSMKLGISGLGEQRQRLVAG
jgi:2-keto-4-pentenoate hydratase/2-oxohepta-3-ene-1,7-dioic acid hydratase in catechol pathway